MENENNDKGFSRRDFLKNTALTGCAAFAASQFDFMNALIARVEAGEITAEQAYELLKTENTLYTVCLNCNTGCGIKVKILDGVAVKIDGNPFNPFNLQPHLPMTDTVDHAVKVDAALCPKGQAGHAGAYDPYRIRKVLKRSGKRGENKWMTVPFQQAIDEIVDGGKLFAHVPGEENREVTGLKDIRVLKDEKTMNDMGKDVDAIRKKKMTVEEFKKKHASNLHYLIDPDHPDYGPKNNQFMYWWGRKKGGRADFSKRFNAAFGTVNTHGHTTVCQGSLYFASKAMSEQWSGDSFKDGQKFYWQVDLENAEFVLFMGANLFDANYGPTNRSPRLTARLAEGKMKIAVVDPRFSKLASKAQYYVPINPGTDAAFAMGMTRWILENKRYDEKFLSNCNKAAALADKEGSWSNGAWLVALDEHGKPGMFVRADELAHDAPGYKAKEKRTDKDGKTSEYSFMVTIKGGTPIAFDPNDDKNAVEGDLFVNTEIKGAKGMIKVKSSLQIMLETSQEKSIAEYASISGTDAGMIETIAKEFTSHGKKAGVDMHRGVAQHTNGFYTVATCMNLNHLIGSWDWAGGMSVASTWNTDGTKTVSQKFKFTKPTYPKAFGLSIIRHDAKYEESTIFSGYPAKRNWWPLSSDIYEEILPSTLEGYPYNIKAMFSYMGTPVYALPAGHTNIEALTNLDKNPLYFACDIMVGTTSMYADYIFPDLHYLERWEMQGSHPNMTVKIQPVRQPVIASPNEIVKVYGQEQPIGYETMWLALAQRLNLMGFGDDGFGEGKGLCRPDDFYLRMVSNVALDGKEPVPEASNAEIDLFKLSRRHLPKNVFNFDRWKSICGDSWRRVVYVLNRGGRFDTHENSYKGDQLANKWGKQINLYQEKTYKCKDAFTGKHYRGLPTYVPVADTMDNSLDGLKRGYDFHLLTQRDVRMTKSRTIANSYLRDLYPENAIIMNRRDGGRMGFKDGDKVRVCSATNPDGVYDLQNGTKKPMVGKVHLTETIKPGVITFTLGHGHWATGAADVTVDGKVIPGDPRRGAGVHANAAMWIDQQLKNTCMIDKVGGSVSFYDTMVKLVRA